MQTGPAEKLGQAIAQLFADQEGRGSFYAKDKGTRKRAGKHGYSTTEKEARVDVYEISRVLGVSISAFEESEDNVPPRDWKDYDRERTPFRLAGPEFVLRMAAASGYSPALIEVSCDLRTHREECAHHKTCRCVRMAYPDPQSLFEGIPMRDEISARTSQEKADADDAAMRRRYTAMVDATLIHALRRATAAERTTWAARKRELRGPRKPVKLFARAGWMLKACEVCGEEIRMLQPVILDRDANTLWHEECRREEAA